ncbi:deoxyguanosinetriphosphate triphosphohydrolase [Hyphomicrobium denitrificans ATCC 51888]|uniref:Deoxyguanosinetriphosphate triphosphohydrolase-like protein n=1 Tax=Hyphomicrobium denitrificans (strain ATCC 51888 / DSM 1869 / NCIMB 11706 / TK 0415) TaxID=582899 RepID=D8JWF6_HYPDA|nr:deoxyguanosinetriphosphate triphosphohydrolase [Hyphomicrobium denitrificans]ADJ23069.1 deoxyguanosinetriphosphate triphosphohydrolase [Hyphomicrobium denitrificans ATCC 51888]
MPTRLKPGADLADYGQNLRPGERVPANYAASAVPSRGRLAAEPDCTTRSPFQRDRDRVLHSSAFRRLAYKTQVFLPHEGDHYRTRLTHTLEVAQIARTMARQLRLDEDLAETIALAHDLGHSPFGHAGERALDTAMTDFGGFDHNAQSVRVVTKLERKYLAFDGLNLTWETLEGLVKHNGPVKASRSAVAKVVRQFDDWRPLDLDKWASAEAQVASLADDIAYLSHDVDDGLRAGLISLGALAETPLAGGMAREVMSLGKTVETGRVIYEITRRMITVMVGDVIDESRRRLAALAPSSADDIRHAGKATVAFSGEMFADLAQLRKFLFKSVYHHRKVLDVMERAEQIVRDLFARYNADPAALPEDWRDAALSLDANGRARLACDFLAGQTDRYAIAEYRRLFDATAELR